MLSRTNEIALIDDQVGAFAISKWLSAAVWSGLILAGQAASLQMIDAGRLIHFQHYRPIAELLGHNLTALSVFGLQLVCVGFGVWKRYAAIRDRLQKFKWWQLALTLLFLTLASAAVTPDASIYGASLAMGGIIQLTNIANVLLLIESIPASSLRSFLERIERFLSGDEGSSIARIGALWIVLLTALLSYFVYQSHPHVPDESQYIFQANYMAAGQLTVQPPLVPEAFSMYMVPTQEARWFGIFPPGWPALLAVGTIIGASWIVNPLLSGLCVLMAYSLFHKIYSPRVARIATMLLCCSPWFIFMGMSYMSHMATLFFSLLAFLLLILATESRRYIWALTAGLGSGVVGLIRPLDAAIVGVLLVGWSIFNNKTWRARSVATVALVLGTAATASLGLLYNKAVTGNAGLSPSDAYYDKYLWPNVMALGFGPERGMHWGLDAFPGHSPFEALINAALNVFQVNTELFGWGIGSLFFVALLVVSGSISKKDIWAIVVIAMVVGSYSLFWYHGGPDFGARYWFLAIIPLVALTAKGINLMSDRFKKRDTDENQVEGRVVLAVGMICVLSLISYIPWRASDKYYHYLGMQPGMEQLARQNNFGRSLVIVRGAEHPDYQSAWVYNPVNFDGNAPIYALYKDEKVYRELLTKYGDRSIWVVNGPTVTAGDYSIVRGPVEANVLLQELN